MNLGWEDLNYWNTGEWQFVEEQLTDLRKKKVTINPAVKNLFASLSSIKYEDVKVMFCGQDPYPQHKYATGLAFSIPKEEKTFPPTLSMIFDEYESDLHYSRPKHGDLTKWVKEGVLLWNCIPSCTEGHSLSHNWDEWSFLTKEIVDKLKEKGCVFVFFGSIARSYASEVYDLDNCRVIETSHPSPRSNNFTKKSNRVSPFIGSRIFSRTNGFLNEIGLETIDWRLE